MPSPTCVRVAALRLQMPRYLMMAKLPEVQAQLQALQDLLGRLQALAPAVADHAYAERCTANCRRDYAALQQQLDAATQAHSPPKVPAEPDSEDEEERKRFDAVHEHVPYQRDLSILVSPLPQDWITSLPR